MVIIDYYSNLGKDDRKVFRDEVMARCGIQYPTFYRKMKKDNWRKPEVEIIAAIIKRMGGAKGGSR